VRDRTIVHLLQIKLQSFFFTFHVYEESFSAPYDSGTLIQFVHNEIDHLAIQFVVDGYRIKGTLTRAEQAEAVRLMNGKPASLIAERLGTNERFVMRLRAEQGLT